MNAITLHELISRLLRLEHRHGGHHKVHLMDFSRPKDSESFPACVTCVEFQKAHDWHCDDRAHADRVLVYVESTPQ